MAQQSKSRKLDQYIVRFPDGLRDRIKWKAEENGRSMNAEIVATLEKAYPAFPAIEVLLDELRQAMETASGHPDEEERLRIESALVDLHTYLVWARPDDEKGKS